MTRTMLRDAIARALFAGATFAIALPLHAQDATPAEGSTEAASTTATLQTVTVTGSRIRQSTSKPRSRC